MALILTACDRKEHTLGNFAPGASVTVAAATNLIDGAAVVLQGVITEKCPVAGCWFMLQDDTGKIKVDTKDAQFVVVDVPLHTKVVVSGHMTTNAALRSIDAAGIRF